MTMIDAYSFQNPVEQLGLDQTRVLRVSEAADMLRLSQAMIYALIKRGELTGLRFGKSVRVREVDLDAYIQRSLTYRDE